MFKLLRIKEREGVILLIVSYTKYLYIILLLYLHFFFFTVPHPLCLFVFPFMGSSHRDLSNTSESHISLFISVQCQPKKYAQPKS